MRKKRLALLILPFVVILGIWAYFFSWNRSNNFSRRNFKFVENEASRQYIEHLSMDEMDMSLYYRFLGPESNIMPAMELPHMTEMELPIDLTYYSMKDNRLEEAFTIAKGTTIDVDYMKEYYNGRGFNSFPTHTRGLRYGQPFTVVGEEPVEEYYYVYLKDIERVYVAYYFAEENRENGYGSRASLRKSIIEKTRRVDRRLYDCGVFCSLD